jgi:hypothetical protein
MVVKEFYIYRKKKLREISVSFWSDVLLCLSEAKPHTDSSVNDILSSDILNFSSLDDFPFSVYKFSFFIRYIFFLQKYRLYHVYQNEYLKGFLLSNL